MVTTRYVVACAYLPEEEINVCIVEGRSELQALLKGIYVCLGKGLGESRVPDDFLASEFIRKLVGLDKVEVLEYLTECEILANVEVLE